MSKLRSAVLYLLSVTMIALLPGCEQEGPVERAGKKVDNTIEDTGKAIKDIAKKKDQKKE